MKLIERTKSVRRTPSGTLSFAALAAGALVLAGCHKEAHPPVKETLPTASVKAVQVSASPRTSFERISGTIVPRVKSAVEAKVVGKITTIAVEPGQTVKAGVPLVEISAPEIQARVDQADAAYQLAEREGKRVQNLFAKQAATRSELDAATAQFMQAKAALEEANVMKSYLTVAAPFDGVISAKFADVGDLAAPGKPLLEIERPGGKRFEAAVPESLISSIKLGGEFDVQLAEVEKPVRGKASEIDPSGDPVSRSWLVKFDLPDGTELRSGAFGRVSIPLEQTTALTIPASALVRRGQLEQIFVVANGQANLRLIKTGRVVDERIEVLSGLSDGETVVLTPAATLKDGQPVNVQ